MNFKKIKSAFLLLVFSTVFVVQVFGQIKNEKRIEFELRNGYGNEAIHKSSLGFFVLESTADKEIDNQVEVKYDLYNSNLELIKTISVQIPENMRFSEKYYNDEHIYNIYKDKKGEFLITGIQIKDLSTTKTSGIMPPKTQLQDMKILGTSAWFYAIIKKDPFIYRVDLQSGKAKIVQLLTTDNPKNTMMENYQLLEKSKELLVFLNKKVQKNVYKTNLIRIDEAGNLAKSFQLSENSKNNISSVSGYRIGDNKMVYTGTYSSKNREQSEGLFFGATVNDKLEFISYYNFLDLKDFLSYLPERKQEKIERKKKKKEKHDAEYKINYFIADHDIIELSDSYLFLGEAYYPTYRSEMFTTFQFVNGVSMPTTSYRSVFDGYQYTHAVLAKFSKEGNLVWDICFAMNPASKPYTVKRFIAISEKTASSIGMVFASGKDIVSKIIDFDGNTIIDNKWDLIETGNATDQTRRSIADADYWYNNYFLIYGTQKIKDQDDKSKRKVYFVNKISY